MRTYYRVWWALGGYKHYDDELEAKCAKHPDPHRSEIDEPTRIDRIEIIMLDNAAESRANDRRLGRVR